MLLPSLYRSLLSLSRSSWRSAQVSKEVAKGLRVAAKQGMLGDDIQPHHRRYVQIFCTKVAEALNIKVVALDPLPQRTVLWTCNHISWADILVVGSTVPTSFISKAEVAKYPVINQLAKACGTLYINRGSGDSASVAEQMADFMRKDNPVIFFPEATTSEGTGLLKLHGKLLDSAIAAQVPVQPIVLCYVDQQGRLDKQIPFVGNIPILEHFKQVLQMRPVTAYVKVLESIDPKGLTRDEMTEILSQRMASGLVNLHQQVLNQPKSAAA